MSLQHASDSAAQRHAEPLIIAAVSRLVDRPLAPTRLLFDGGLQVQIDGASPDRSVLVEAYAQVRALRAALPRKELWMIDVLKPEKCEVDRTSGWPR